MIDGVLLVPALGNVEPLVFLMLYEPLWLSVANLSTMASSSAKT